MTDLRLAILTNRKVIASVITVAVSLMLSWVLNEAHCYLNECIEDDAGKRAVALIGPIVIFAHIIITLAVFFIAALILAKHMAIIFAALIPSTVFALFLAWQFYNPDIDSLQGIAGLFVWLFVPWFLANLGGLYVWRMR